MHAGFLYRLNYEDYQKREQELDEKIKQLALAVGEGEVDAETGKKYAIFGALTLYLDFVNLFLYLLRLLGNRK